MLTREMLEAREYEILSALATKSADTLGRVIDEEKCEYRTEFQRDRDRIIHSKAFRRLMHKTQVFLTAEEDHFRTRLTHTLEVAQVSRTVARILCYNEDLAEAIALGHDLGHTPFGHTGEFILNNIHEGGFAHNVQSLRTVDKLEPTPSRRGLNLTKEVRDGMLNHRGETTPITREGQIVKICDRIAYVNHDIDDAVRSNVISIHDLPADALDVLGFTHSQRINKLVVDLSSFSEGRKKISLSPEVEAALLKLRTYMFTNVYNNEKVLLEVNMSKAEVIISSLYSHYIKNPDELPSFYKDIVTEDGKAVAVKDFISGMTDRYAIKLYNNLKDR